MSTASSFLEQQALALELDILRQLVVLSMGPEDPLYLLMNDALRSLSMHKMKKALSTFDHLSDTERNRVLGLCEGGAAAE
ncbi:MAG TPA: hypothetical protein PK847_12755 [Candidatus Sumerlaeota bacterium]|nr:MAG: hypothetical protein BWZ08_01113 [candidate division BRC1 bacterium ADurb.BinA292]HOE97443.1 hypothetical protein [Candidatus Sumerlaeota bacterium]HOR29726.1 hypothetical protein [Candidatus Sumerlaeota bacterium]